MKSFFTKTRDFIKTHPKIDIALAALGLAVFVTIALLNAGRAGIWFDEAFSYYIAQYSFIDIANFTAADVHPPLYYWLLKLWMGIFGSSELALRSLSVLFGAGVVGTSYLLVRRFFGRLSGAVALLLLALSPMLIRYSDEARMYTLAALIVLVATHVLVRAVDTGKRRWWVVYGLLVGLGMWTHYFTALAWLAHWVWRAAVVKKVTNKAKTFFKKFFSFDWILAHIIAVGFFLPWLPFMAKQLGGLQIGGFWIGAVGADSFTNFLTNVFYYLEHSKTNGFIALLLGIAVLMLLVLGIRTYRKFGKDDRHHYLLLITLSVVPVVLLFLASIPPLKSSFVERYLLPAAIGFAMFAAVTLVYGLRSSKPILRIGGVVLLAGMMIFGITNVYFYGNYNKNSNTHVLTRELIQEIAKKAKPGEPIIANSPWIFYEAVYYDTKDHPVYFIDEKTQYIYGSVEMLRTSDAHKIKDMAAFAKEHPTIWYIAVIESPVEPAYDSWKRVSDISITSPVDGRTLYRGAEFQIN